MLSVLNDKHPRCRRHSNDKLSNSRNSHDGDSHHSPAPLAGNNVLSLNFIPDGGNRGDAGTPAMSRRGDNNEKHYNGNGSQAIIKGKASISGDYTTIYMPNG